MNIYIYFIIYIIAINLLSFYVMYSDKSKAIRNARRIPEKSIFLLCFLGGSLGTYLGMYKFRHKTKHINFLVMVPVIFLLNIIMAYFILKYIK